MLASKTFFSPYIVWSTERATFATGCFRCTLPVFDRLIWVKDVHCGWVTPKHCTDEFTPLSSWETSYKNVFSGTVQSDYQEKNHKRQWLQIIFNPQEITYTDLLEVFWETVDALDATGQYHEKWMEHTTALYYHTGEQKRVADISLEKMILASPYDCLPVQTHILPYWNFFLADDMYQKWYKKFPDEWKNHVEHSGRSL